MQNFDWGNLDWENFDFDALCEEAHAGFNKAEIALKQSQSEYAAKHGVEPSQVEVLVSDISVEYRLKNH